MDLKTMIITILAVAVGLACAYWLKSTSVNTVDVAIPDLTPESLRGLSLFDTHCANCHGKHASGNDSGPPLIHRIYEPSHHSDASFYSAVKNGVRQHHWVFGNMPPVEEVSRAEVTLILTYLRELQRANGIH